MAVRLDGTLTDIARLPPVGTPERREWDVTIREVIELYPDWSAIGVGGARLRRETYEWHYKEYFEDDENLLCSVASPESSGYDSDSWGWDG
jgi:hypothetical protein